MEGPAGLGCAAGVEALEPNAGTRSANILLDFAGCGAADTEAAGIVIEDDDDEPKGPEEAGVGFIAIDEPPNGLEEAEDWAGDDMPNGFCCGCWGAPKGVLDCMPNAFC